MTAWISTHKVLTFLIALAVGFVGWVVFFAGNDDPLSGVETAPIEKQVVRQIISETGTVEPSQEASLSFSASGPVAEILISEGAVVEKGQQLARLQTNSLSASRQQALAQLAQAQARLSELEEGPRAEERAVSGANQQAARVRVESAEENLQTVQDTQDELVRSAREDLYTSNLVPYLEDGGSESRDYNYTPPTVTGTYDSTQKGQYQLDLYNSGADSGWSFQYSGLESGRARVSANQPQTLGDGGLFIQFPQNFARGRNITWVLEIPNTRSPQYTKLKNALQTAKENRTAAIRQAENALADAESALAQAGTQSDLSTAGTRSQQVEAQEAVVAGARAGLAQANAALGDAILFAPFAATVASISVELGERAGLGQAVMRLISDDPYQISVRIPEVDTAEIEPGDTAEITLDAFESKIFSGAVTKIAPTAESIQGVQTLEVTVSLSGNEEVDIRAGLSADVDITAAETSGLVIAAPTRAIQQKQDGSRFVYTKNATGDGLIRTDVTVGLRGSEGFAVIKDGISAGAEIVTFIDGDTRDRLREAGKISE